MQLTRIEIPHNVFANIIKDDDIIIVFEISRYSVLRSIKACNLAMFVHGWRQIIIYQHDVGGR